jgi:ribonuclease VapC
VAPPGNQAVNRENKPHPTVWGVPSLLKWTVLAAAPSVGICAPNRTELLLVIQSRLGDTGAERAKMFLNAQRIQTIALDEALADTAADGFRRFGKGRHPAGLNFGDCFSYALAIRERAPLLFKGNDFSKTDIRAADYTVP